jgi:hypothetical protein
MSAAELDRIRDLGRARGAELADTVAGKTHALRVLIGPELDHLRARAKAS